MKNLILALNRIIRNILGCKPCDVGASPALGCSV